MMLPRKGVFLSFLNIRQSWNNMEKHSSLFVEKFEMIKESFFEIGNSFVTTLLSQFFAPKKNEKLYKLKLPKEGMKRPRKEREREREREEVQGERR